MTAYETYSKLLHERAMIVRTNASRRLRSLPPLPLPPKPVRPKAVTLFDSEGVYVGTWPAGMSVDEVKADAMERGIQFATFRVVDAFR